MQNLDFKAALLVLLLGRLEIIFSFIRNEMSQSAVKRITNLKDDDLFLSFDADEIPKTEARRISPKFKNSF
jgi:hypothetical protein